MDSAALISAIARLGFGAIATFFAILLWSTTRDVAWMFVVMGTIIRYGEIMYSTFLLFGILQTEPLVFGIPLVRLILTNLPTVLYTVAFIIVVARSRGR